MKTELRVEGLEGVLGMLQKLPAEVASKRGGLAKLSLALGARKIRNYAKQNLRRSIDQGPTTRTTGELEKRVVASRGKAPFEGKGERYVIKVKKRDYLNADGVRTNPLMTANLLEYGSSHQPATPWLRPAVEQHGEEVIRLVTADLGKRIEAAAKKLGRR